MQLSDDFRHDDHEDEDATVKDHEITHARTDGDTGIDPRPAGHAAGGEPYVPESIVCVDCGGTCHLLTAPPEDRNGHTGFRTGDVVAYRCSDCLDRWDLVVE